MNPLDPSMIHTHFRAREIGYAVDQEGDFIARFSGYREAIGSSLALLVEIVGEPAEVLTVTVLADRMFPTELVPELLVVTNTWAGGHRWPQPVVDQRKDEVSIRLHQSLRCAAGVTQEQLDDFINIVFGGAVMFWRDFKATDVLTPALVEQTISHLEVMLGEQRPDAF